MFAPTELLIVLAIIILLFGVGRIGRLGGELGQTVSAFRRAVNADTSEQK